MTTPEVAAPTTAAGISKIYGVPASAVQIETNGKITITFGKTKHVLETDDIEKYYETYCAVNKYKMSNKPADIERAKKQASTASVKISPDGTLVTYTLKKDMNVEEFKKLFDIKHGTLRGALKQRHNEGKFNAEMAEVNDQYKGKYQVYIVDEDSDTDRDEPGHKITYSDGIVEYAIDDAGHYQHDYRNYTLTSGEKVTIGASANENIETHWYDIFKFW